MGSGIPFRLFGLLDATVDANDRAEWLTPPFNRRWRALSDGPAFHALEREVPGLASAAGLPGLRMLPPVVPAIQDAREL